MDNFKLPTLLDPPKWQTPLIEKSNRNFVAVVATHKIRNNIASMPKRGKLNRIP